MKILVIGGTYFLGRAFVGIAAKENEVTLLNRGNKKIELPSDCNIKEIRADRHSLRKGDLDAGFDVVVDFCAYEKGDIRQLIDAAKDVSQYIFISTTDVYKRGTGKVIDEDGEFEDRDFGGAAGAYILGKVALEKELLECRDKYGIRISSIRPVFIYGPNNYAPRENIFFTWIKNANQAIYPADSTGSFQMVYVYDLARIILSICGNPDAYGKNFNICGKGEITYDSFFDALIFATGKQFERVPLSVNEINKRNIPLPFPLTAEESESYISKNCSLLNIDYTELNEGLKFTYASIYDGK